MERVLDSQGLRDLLQIQPREGLLPSDWKKHGKRNVYALVRCWPKPPESQRLLGFFFYAWFTSKIWRVKRETGHISPCGKLVSVV